MVNPIQSHFVNQYDGGQLGQRHLWYLCDQSCDSEQCESEWTRVAGSHEIKVTL